MRIVPVLGLVAILVAGCVSSGAESPEPSETTSARASPASPSASTPLTATPTASSAPAPSPAPTTTQTPAPTPLAEIWPVGMAVMTITDDLRVRSRPEVSDGSVKYDPLLPNGTPLVVRDGPVAGSGYWWYRIEIPSRANFELRDGIREGWVAVADHDGTPWLGIAGWPTAARSGVAMSGTVQSDDGWFDGLSIVITGLEPGEPVALAAVGEYSVQWICGTEPEPCGELGCGHAYGEVASGTVVVDAAAVADRAGTAASRLEFIAPPPVKSCPAGPAASWGMQWSEWMVRIADRTHGLVLAPDRIDFGWTY
jgi:hypothetical protein